MVDYRYYMEQLSEIEGILNNFKQHNLKMDDAIIVSNVIDKLSLLKDVKKCLKHKRKMSL